MAWKYNPFTDALDKVGSGGASYIDGVVADPTALPVTLGTPALDSVYLAKAGSGVWLINRRPAGLYCRVANNGVAADWTYLGAFPEVNADGNWELYNTADPTKELKFDLSGLPTATTRTVNAPDGNGKMLVEGQSIGATTRNTGAFTTLSANNGTLTASAPVLDLSQTWNNAAVTFTGLRFNVTNTASATASPLIDLQVGGVSRMRMTRGGTLHLSEHSNSGLYSPAPVWTGSTAGLLAATNLAVGSSLDTILERGGAGILEQRNAANPQTFRIYNTFTDASNYERGFMRWSSNVLQIGTEKAGTGSARNLELLTDNVWRARIQSEGLLLNGNGPRVYFGNPLISGDAESGLSLDLQPFGAGSVIVRSGLLKMNGTTNAFPALKRSSTTLQVRLANDSDFAPLSCGALTLNGNLDASTRDLVTDTTTGTRIGTATNQLLGFYGATPVDRPATVADPAGGGTVDAEARTAINDIIDRLQELGLIA